MGVGINTMAVANSALGVAANRLAGSISETNDADKNELMAQKAKMNAQKMKNLRLQNRKLRLQNNILKKKETNMGGDK